MRPSFPSRLSHFPWLLRNFQRCLNIVKFLHVLRTSLVAQMVNCLSTMRETWVQSLGWEDSLENEWQPTPVLLLWKSQERRSLVQATVHGSQMVAFRAVLDSQKIAQGHKEPLCSPPESSMRTPYITNMNPSKLREHMGPWPRTKFHAVLGFHQFSLSGSHSGPHVTLVIMFPQAPLECDGRLGSLSLDDLQSFERDGSGSL